jgi:hypothetical protein
VKVWPLVAGKEKLGISLSSIQVTLCCLIEAIVGN